MAGKRAKNQMALVLAGAFFLPFLPFFTKFPIKITAKVNVKAESVTAVLQKANIQSKENPYGWEKMSGYTTYFNQKDGGRCENIALAASLIDGVTIQPYGEFSFNQTVGKRTKEAGFQQAKIIVNGEYAEGVGGGVCQVSTTLYNAALKSGLTVEEYHPHSLKVAYVAPSRDAMVSTQSDLKFINPYPFAVYLSVQTFDGGITARFYGKSMPFRYEIVTKVVEEIDPPPDIVKDGGREEILRLSQKGIKSEMYLECYQGERLVSSKRMRVDEYRPIQGIIVKKNANVTNKDK